MAKKRKIEKPRREPTKHQLARWQKEKRRQRIILGAGIFIIAAAFLIVVVGWYVSQYRPLHQTVIRVNQTEFNMKYYIEMLKLNSKGQSAEYIQFLADSMTKQIEQSELIKQEAVRLGFNASKEEVKEKLKDSDLPKNDVTEDMATNQILIEKLQDEYFGPQVPESAEQRHIMAMLLESDRQANEVRARLENGEDFTDLAGELSLEYRTKTGKGDLGWHPRNILSELLGTSAPVDYAFNAEIGALSQSTYDGERTKEVGYWLIKVVDRIEGEDEVHVQAMLLGSEEEAQEVRARLEAGEDFATLAKELSQLTGAEENGGELSLMTGMMTPAFDGFAFDNNTELGTLSEPIRDVELVTKGGYWLIKVLDKDDNRPIEADDRDLLKAKAFDEWVTLLWVDPNNNVDDSFLDDEKKAWAIEQAMRG
ncbi:peptidylprolyl isomerase [Chloroflexota bacterium]